MLKPPINMMMSMHELTSLIRSHVTQDVQSCRYRAFIRDNIYSVITHAFPLFCAQISEEELSLLIEEWLKTHKATEPEFHHIATEFVLFVQQRNGRDVNSKLSTKWVALLEYEWTVFNAEMNDVQLPNIKVWWDDVESQPGAFSISLNPTLKLIEVPFVIHPESVAFLTHNKTTVCYGVFRHTSHQVVSQKLRELDVALLQMIKSTSEQSLTQLEQQITQNLSGFDFLAWVKSFYEKELISLSILGEIL